MSVVEEVTAANERYSSGFAKGGLPMPPRRKFAVVTCMDARIDPAMVIRYFGTKEKLFAAAAGGPAVPEVAYRFSAVHDSVHTIVNAPKLAQAMPEHELRARLGVAMDQLRELGLL